MKQMHASSRKTVPKTNCPKNETEKNDKMKQNDLDMQPMEMLKQQTNISGEGMLPRPRLRRAFSQTAGMEANVFQTQRRGSHSESRRSIMAVLDISECTNDVHKRKNRRGKQKTGSGTRRRSMLFGSMPKMAMLTTFLRARRGSKISRSVQRRMSVHCRGDGKVGSTKDNCEITNMTETKLDASRKNKSKKGRHAMTAVQSIDVDTNGNDHGSSSESIPSPRRRRRRAATDGGAHELKIAAAVVSSKNNEHVQLLEIAKTTRKVCILFVSSMTCTLFSYIILQKRTRHQKNCLCEFILDNLKGTQGTRGNKNVLLTSTIWKLYLSILNGRSLYILIFSVDASVVPSFRPTWPRSYFWASGLLQVCVLVCQLLLLNIVWFLKIYYW